MKICLVFIAYFQVLQLFIRRYLAYTTIFFISFSSYSKYTINGSVLYEEKGKGNERWLKRNSYVAHKIGPKLAALITNQNANENCLKKSEERREEIAVFAAGCFWSVQLKFDRIVGVIKTEVGYTGGKLINPSYEEVMKGNSGHTEAVRIIFDPNIVNYYALVQAFFEMHDPTTLNQQGNDYGDNYRSGIYFLNSQQETLAHQAKLEANQDILRLLGNIVDYKKQAVVTEIMPFKNWFPAEKYHQDYLFKHGQTKEKGSLDHIRCYG